MTHADVNAGAPPRLPALCGDLDMRIDRDGMWFYHGSPIDRKELVRLFASVLRREDDGFWLVTPAERARIGVEDAPFVAVELTVEGRGRAQVLRFRTNVDDVIAAGADHPITVIADPETGHPRPYVRVRDGLDARIARPVYYELVELGHEETIDGCSAYGVWSGSRFFGLGLAERGS